MKTEQYGYNFIFYCKVKFSGDASCSCSTATPVTLYLCQEFSLPELPVISRLWDASKAKHRCASSQIKNCSANWFQQHHSQNSCVSPRRPEVCFSRPSKPMYLLLHRGRGERPQCTSEHVAWTQNIRRVVFTSSAPRWMQTWAGELSCSPLGKRPWTQTLCSVLPAIISHIQCSGHNNNISVSTPNGICFH